ncbi:helix-turn-helix transcriptional regulator [Prevotella falsenii]|uniref:helix-turn-helix transcriptional regulator n=1 Tax=Prevotella falsenii TaxID=515414 RepID=UPI001E643FFB|nr:hypothetical protein [Prevotella falsenii]
MTIFQSKHTHIISILILLATTLTIIGCSSFIDKEEKVHADSLLNSSYLEIINYSFVKAYKNISDAQTIYEKTNNQKGQAICHIHLALLYEGIGLWREAWTYLKKAQTTVSQLNPIEKYRYYYANTVYLIQHNKDYAGAERVMTHAIANDRRISNKVFLQADLSNLAEIYIKQGKVKEASEILNKLDKQANKFFYTQLMYCRLLIAKQCGQIDSIYTYAQKCLEQSVRFRQLNIQVEALQAMTHIDSARQDYRAFVNHFTQYYYMRDSLNGAMATYKIGQIQEKAKIETEQLKAREEMKVQRILLLLVAVVAGLIICVSVLFYYRTKQRKRIVELEAKELSDKLKRTELEKELSKLKMKAEQEKLAKSQQENISMSLQLAMLSDPKEKKRMQFFDEQFQLIENDFCRRLEKQYPTITKAEKRLVCLIKTGLDAHEIMSVLNISGAGLYKLRYRLRKRLGLDNENLEKYIQQME